MNKSQLEEMAVKELLKEAERGKERYQTMGPRGWYDKRVSLNLLRICR